MIRYARISFFLFGITLLFSSTLQAQIELSAGQTSNQSITKGQVRSFIVNAEAHSLVEIKFLWQGIDLNVSVADLSGTQLLPASILVSAPGPVSLVFKTEKPGPHKVDVTTPARQKITGPYQIRLETVRVFTTSDQERITAQNALAAARSKPPAEAIELYKQVLLVWQTMQDWNAEAQTLMLLGNAYRAIRNPETAKANFDTAVANYKAAAATWNRHGDQRAEGYAILTLGHLLRSVSAKDAIPSYEQAASLFELTGDRRGLSDALYNHAFAAMMIGRTPDALRLLQQAVELRRAEADRLGEANALNMMADAHRLLSDYEKSLRLYDDAIKAVQGLEHPLLEASLINGKALVSDDQGYWEIAELEYLRALNVLESFLQKPVTEACGPRPSPSAVASCRSAAYFMINLGEVYNSLGEPRKALSELNKSLAIHDALGDANVSGRGEVRLHLGHTHFLLGENFEALKLYEKALELKQSAGEDRSVALIYTYMGMAHSAQKDFEPALKNYQQALPMLEKSGDKRGLAIALDKTATTLSLLRQETEAARHFDAALELWRRIKDPDGEATTLYNRAEAEKQSGKLAAAVQDSDAAIKLVESMRTRIRSEKFRTSYLADKKRYYELAVDLRMGQAVASADKNLIATAFETNEMSRARVLLDSLSEAFLPTTLPAQTAKPQLLPLAQKRAELVEHLSAKARARTAFLSASEPNDSIAVIDDEIRTLTEKLDVLDRQIRSETPRLSALVRPQPATLTEVQQQLDNETLLLEYALGETRSFAWVISLDEIRGIELAPRREIESVATRLLQALTVPTRPEPNETFQQQTARWANADREAAEAASSLSRLVLEPLASLLSQRRLVIVADGTLQLVPFGLLPDPVMSPTATNSRGILLQNREVVSLPSASVLHLQRQQLAKRKPAPFSVAVIADPVFDSQDIRVVRALTSRRRFGREAKPPATDESHDKSLATALRDVGLDPRVPLRRLLMSRTEALDIARVVPGDRFEGLDFSASRATVTSGVLSKYRYVHFATHGVLDFEHPELSGIVLSMFDHRGNKQDGYLRLYEIYNLTLPAELVVLSGCQTGVGKQVKGEGLIALTRGFMHAGAARVVASLWKVDDSATADLMAQFYKEMFKNHRRPAEALRLAQLHLSQQQRWRSPHFWAGFVLQGEWR